MPKFNISDGSWESRTLGRNEAESLLDFLIDHVHCDKELTLATSCGSGIGQNVVVQCGCGVQEDITDYASW